MSSASTEGTLRDWRYGNTQAERLCAALLHLESFEDVDPQHPLGGPDGLKDIRCNRNGKVWIAASYIPSTPPSFKDIQTKFGHDFAGVATNGADGFAFSVNQPLTIGERELLQAAASAAPIEIYHLERTRSLLDSPKGCGIRLEYLRIPMSEPEQWAFSSAMNYDVVRKLAENEKRHDEQMKGVHGKLDLILSRTTAIEMNLHAQPSSLQNPVHLDLLRCRLRHSVLRQCVGCTASSPKIFGYPRRFEGRFRAVQVWIGAPDSTHETARYLPPPPQDVPGLVEEWLRGWHRRHRELRGKEKGEIVNGLAELHHRFLSIHPFMDANGRVARSVTDQAARELLN